MARQVAIIESPIDDVLVEVSDVGVVGCGFRRGAVAPPAGRSRLLDQAVGELREYFSGDRQRFEVPVDWRGIAGFQRAVLELCAAIPFAGTRTYGEIGEDLDAARPGGPRAVGQALRYNPIGIVIPCHRVVGSSGDLVGYAGGPDTGGDVSLKRALLDHERRVAGLTLF